MSTDVTEAVVDTAKDGSNGMLDTQWNSACSSFASPNALYTWMLTPPAAVEDKLHEETPYVAPKGRKILGVRLPVYRSPMTQIWIVGFILFLNPGYVASNICLTRSLWRV